MLERHQEEWFAFQEGAPGVEVHRDPDITWKLENGVAWSNAGTRLRFRTETIDRRLDEILAKFGKHGRGAGFWVDVGATPGDLEDHLKARCLRRRKYFAGMVCDLRGLPSEAPVSGITVSLLRDHSVYLKYPHLVWGKINTPVRRAELGRLKHLTSSHPDRMFDFAALADGRPEGACSLFLSRHAAGIHDLGVAEDERGKGVGAALIGHALRWAPDQGKRYVVLISCEMGFGMYRKAGFQEVCRIGFWYRAPARAC